MVVYLYRWKIKPGKEEQFEKAWSYITEQLRDHAGSLGSRLHKGSDGLWYGYAQWPSVEVREKASVQHDEINKVRVLMRDAIQESLPHVVLNPVKDYLVK